MSKRPPVVYLHLAAVARRLGVRFDTALHLVRENRLRGRLDSFNRWWIAEHELARYVAQQRPARRVLACLGAWLPWRAA